MRQHRLGDLGVVAVGSLDGVRVSFRGTVAGLASLDVIFSRKNEFRVACLRKFGGFVFVAVRAGRWSRPKRAGRRVKIRGVRGDGRSLGGFGALLGEARTCRKSKTARKQKRLYP